VIDPAVALRAAVVSAFKDIGLIDFGEEEVEAFIVALKERGYIVMHEFNGAHPDARRKE